MQAWFDPGDTTGICIFNDEFLPIQFMQLSLDDLLEWVMNTDLMVDTVGYEEFIVFRQKAHTQVGSRMKVGQAIGGIKMFAKKNKAELVVQKPDIKQVALKWSGIKMPSQHSQTHQWDAFLHGYYYNRRKGNIKSEVQGIANRS